jgi:hypothetical protein
MTSRTIDIDCDSCGKYMFSLQPNDSKGIAKTYFCKSKKCKEAATVAKLRGEDVSVK